VGSSNMPVFRVLVVSILLADGNNDRWPYMSPHDT
jgi:hypothetical protein